MDHVIFHMVWFTKSSIEFSKSRVRL